MSEQASIPLSLCLCMLSFCGAVAIKNCWIAKQYQYLCHSTVHSVTPLAPAVHHCVMNNGEKEKEIEMKGHYVRGKNGNEKIGSKIDREYNTMIVKMKKSAHWKVLTG